jgi:hypothetical protein
MLDPIRCRCGATSGCARSRVTAAPKINRQKVPYPDLADGVIARAATAAGSLFVQPRVGLSAGRTCGSMIS